LVNQKTKEIICIAVRKGKVHDFRIWKESQIDIGEKTELLADKGYQGIKKIHDRSRTPANLSMILWQYGLDPIEQLDRIYDWMEDT